MKKVGGNHEYVPRLTDAAEIDQCDGGEDAQTKA